MKEFFKNAQILSKNPLSIIALFITLVYGFACLLFGFTANSIVAEYMIYLILFITIYPVLILLAFVYLVVFHHTKLYAPSDYKDEKLFFGQISFERQAERIKEEVKLDQDPSVDILDHPKTDSSKMESQESSDIVEEVAVVQQVNNSDTSESQTHDQTSLDIDGKKRKFSNEYFHNNILKNPLNKYFMFEQLAIKKLEQEYKTTISRQIVIDNIEADGYVRIKNKHFLIEVKYISGDGLTSSMINNMKNFLDFSSELRKQNFKIVFVIVFENNSLDNIRSQIQTHFPPNSGFYQFKYYKADYLNYLLH